MSTNPYQSTCIPTHEPEAELAVDTSEISRKDYLQFRQNVALLITTMATFFMCFCMQMFRNSMYVEAAITSGFWITMLVCVRGALKSRTPQEAKLTPERYRTISSELPRLCLWTGTAMCICGVLQAVYVPPIFQFNAWGFITCGVAAIGLGFRWSRV